MMVHHPFPSQHQTDVVGLLPIQIKNRFLIRIQLVIENLRRSLQLLQKRHMILQPLHFQLHMLQPMGHTLRSRQMVMTFKSMSLCHGTLIVLIAPMINTLGLLTGNRQYIS